MKQAWLFPGQGSQKVGMGRDLFEQSNVARRVFEQADQALGFSISSLCFEGPEEELRRTANTQPALLTTSIAAARVLEDRGLQPDAVAGHSLGEYSALVVAGTLSFRDAVRAVRKRGQFMQDAVPEGEGAMAAILGLDAPAVADICRQTAAGEIVSPANYNARGQVVIAGHAPAVARAMQAAKQAGARRALPLKVSAPFHCELMAPAAERLARVLDSMEFKDARVPVWTNTKAEPLTAAGGLQRALVEQVASPVRWEETMQRLGEQGFQSFFEVGPGTVLAGLVKRTLPDAGVQSLADWRSIQELESAAS